MQTIAPTQMATGAYMSPVHPSATKMLHVRISVAIVIPEIGFDDDPIKPVIRDDTVTKKKPNTSSSSDARKLPCVGILGATARKIASASEPPSTTASGRSRSVRNVAACDLPALKSFMLSRNDGTIVGTVRHRLMMPAARTAPAPVEGVEGLQSCRGGISEKRGPLGGAGGERPR